MIDPVKLAQHLLRIPSITPEDGGCQELIASHLEELDFSCERMPFGEVKNLWATRRRTGPMLVFAGHTDVVPPGPVEDWTHPPFEAVIEGDKLYARGAADMKGSIACFIAATTRFLHDFPDTPLSLGYLITSDEEGPAVDGTAAVLRELGTRNERFEYCLVGEPSSVKRVGDEIKNGRRGSLSGELTIHGVQGHIAYPHLAENPVHRFAPALQALVSEVWDEGNEDFPPTSFQISNIHAGTGATNVIPGHLQVSFNFRFSTEQTPESLKQRVHAILDEHGLKHDLDWSLSGLPFLTQRDGTLVRHVRKAIESVTGQMPSLSTGGGTSDGRFIAQTGAQVIELGPLNATIHKVDEHVAVDDLRILTEIYYQLLVNFHTDLMEQTG
ncbi:succinyldiaminopimelate desuccinylase [Sulfurivirga caldicuralii]|uniref:Succinyl-diaminopimelate desuccinylase n=1 Tax=Sulfurivirga caldicuralii TaxID=364032 RepID=A0A1N6EVZ1_9GAMM|nr:succinyl-diaminopimelate desuccinylase [Sulfurivirga caldicuralii]SIN87121.1 succinyldiaminopimelate desuccinylase [Sulfurivirga caldicuralii]